jgi:ATP-dependent Clp protease ATP-binding subunit ClpA
LIQNKILNPIATRIIARTIEEGDQVHVSMNGEDVVITTQTIKKKRISSLHGQKKEVTTSH